MQTGFAERSMNIIKGNAPDYNKIQGKNGDRPIKN